MPHALAALSALVASSSAQTPLTDYLIPTDSSLPGFFSSVNGDLAITDPTGGSSPTLHAVWQDFRDGEWGIYYRRSTDGGVSWASSDTLISANASGEDYGPAVKPRILSNGDSWLFVVWLASKRTPGGWNETRPVLQVSVDNGASWQPNTFPMNINTLGTAPGQGNWAGDLDACMDATGRMYVVWAQNDGDADQIYFFQVDLSQLTIVPAKVLSVDGAGLPTSTVSGYPSVACDETGGVTVAYVENDPIQGGGTPYVRSSTNGGASFGTRRALKTGGAFMWESAVQRNGAIWLVAWNERNSELYSSYSTNSGATWSGASRLDDDDVDKNGSMSLAFAGGGFLASFASGSSSGVGTRTTRFNVGLGSWSPSNVLDIGFPSKFASTVPSLSVDGTTAWLVWSQATSSATNGYYDLFSAYSNDSGSSWSAPLRVNHLADPAGVARSTHPRVVARGPNAFVIWDDRRNWIPPSLCGLPVGLGAPEIYFTYISQ